jgi:peptidoglycan/LPS O-acetylase OafA/YrhL
MTTVSASPPLIPSLDGIRALSVLIVVLGHSGFDGIIPGGLGVTIFFFLSGYLITTLMLSEHERTGEINIAQFYIRRLLRLMPPLLITLAIAYTLTATHWLAGAVTLQGLAAQCLYFANYYGLFFDPGNTIPDGTGILWSLAVEEHFYIIYPVFLTMLLGRSLSQTRIAVILALVCFGILAWRFYLIGLPGFTAARTYYASDTRIDSIIYGCLLALMWNPIRSGSINREMHAGHWVMVTGSMVALLATLVYREPSFRETLRYTIQGIALIPLFYCAIRFSTHRLFQPLNHPWIQRLGLYSYAIYLIHYIIIKVLEQQFPGIAGHSISIFIVALAISIGYAELIERFVDPFFRHLRHHYRGGVVPAA